MRLKSIYLEDASSKIIHVDLMIAMLRLGCKYDFERFKLLALDQLKAFFPDAFEKWDECFDDSFTTLNTLMESRIFELTCVSLELNIQRVLPIAFFTCLRQLEMVRYQLRFCASPT